MSAPPPLLLPLLFLLLAAAASAEQVCYDGLGCFDNTGVWAGRGLPQSPDDVDARFLLFTRDAPAEDELIFNKSGMLAGSDFDARRARTVVLLHGFADSCYRAWPVAMMTALLHREDANVLCVDWPLGSVEYAQARDNARLVGALGAQMLGWIGNVTGLTTDQVYLIGHDVGAHAAGYVGGRLAGVGRISGLDPASLDFEAADAAVRLDAADARLVDIVVTDGGGDAAFGLGVPDDTGSVNFRPHGGVGQPGCDDTISHHIRELSNLRTLKISPDDWLTAACSHFRSTALFIESINTTCGFVSLPCDSWQALLDDRCHSQCTRGDCQTLGYGADRQAAAGTFFLFTAAQAPFCRAFCSAEVIVADDQPETRGALTVALVGADGSAPAAAVLVDGRIAGYDLLRADFVDADPDAGAVRVALTYTREWTLVGRYSKTLRLGTVRLSLLDGDAQYRTFAGTNVTIETGVTSVVALQA